MAGKVALGRTAAAAAMVAALAGCDRIPGTPQYTARFALAGMLFDPGAARITYLRTTPRAVCGTVNGKNRYGAYVGAQFFALDRKNGRMMIYDKPTIDDYRAWASGYSDESYDTLEVGCAFGHFLEKECGVPLGAEAPDPRLCRAWQAQDWGTLRQMSRYY